MKIVKSAVLVSVCALLAQTVPDEALERWQALSPVPLHAALHHVQGIDVEEGVVWVSSVDAKTRKGYLSRFEAATGRLLKQVEVQEGDRFHPGGISLDGDSIWVPVAEYRRDSSAMIQRRDKRTLELRGQFAVADHVGCLAAGADTLVGGTWESRIFYTWSKDGRQLAKRPNPRTTSYQDLKIDGTRLVASGTASKDQGAVEWLRLDDLGLVRRVVAGKTDRGVRLMQEGMTWRGGRLYLLPEDDPARLFEFRPK
jgi:hypothetical protein